MADQLFPTFDFPDLDEDEEEVKQEERYMPSVCFDFEKGDFVRDGANRMTAADGRDAFIQWCTKAISTEREDLLAYGDDYGVEFEEMVDAPDHDQRESWIEETITEALKVNPACESVDNFEFSYEGDQFYVTFTVKGYGWNEETITVPVPTQ